jgi:hypothetical protein
LGSKIEPESKKSVLKNDEKMMMTRMAKKSHIGDYGTAFPATQERRKEEG